MATTKPDYKRSIGAVVVSEAMAITGITGDLRHYLIGQRSTAPNSPENAQLFLPSHFPYLAQSFAISWRVAERQNK